MLDPLPKCLLAEMRAIPCAMALAVLASTSAPAFAQSSIDEETAGPSIALGETSLFPSLRVDARRNDNIYRAPENEIAANSLIVAPRLLWVADRRLLSLRGTYDGEYASSDEPVLDHADHRLGLTLTTTPGKRLGMNGRIVYVRGHQTPGTDLTRRLGTDFDEPVTFDDLRLDAEARYGANQARGNVAAGLRLVNRGYTNLEVVTDGLDFLRIEPYGRFSLRISGDTRALVELRFADVDFDADVLDRQDVSLLGGVSFSLTGRSSGELKVGATRSDYAADGRDDETTLIVEGRLDYAPRDFSRLELTLVRRIDNTVGTSLGSVEGAAVRDTVLLEWDYDWSDRLSQAVFAGYERITRGCPDLGESGGRLGLELALQLRRWFDVGLSGTAIRRTGEGCAEADAEAAGSLDHDTALLGVFLRARL